jgi:hypothetical protein
LITKSVICDSLVLAYTFPVETDAKDSWMTRLLIVAAGLGLTLSAADACDYNRSAKADVDKTVVASVTTDEAKPMSTPQTVILDETPSVEATEENAQ